MYQNRNIYDGPRGGKYILRNGKKIYLPKLLLKNYRDDDEEDCDLCHDDPRGMYACEDIYVSCPSCSKSTEREC